MNETRTHDRDKGAMARAFDDDRFAWARVGRTRRRLVLAEVGILAALTVTTVAASFGEVGWPTWISAVWTVGLMAFVAVHICLNAGIRGLYDRRGHTLDEHQRHIRQHSHAAVGWPSGILTLAAWTSAVGVLSRTGHVRMSLALGFLLWFMAMLMPYWHLGWTLPGEEAAFESA